MYIFKILFDFFKDFKFTVILFILFTILSFPLESIIIPQIYSNFFDVLKKETDVNVFIKYISMVIFIQLIVNFSNYMSIKMESILLPEMNHYIINYIFKNLLNKYENSAQELELGKIITRLSTVPNYLKEFFSDFLVWIFPRLVTIIIINIYFFYININLGIVSLLLLILYYYFNIKYFMKCTILSNERHILFENKNQLTQDKLSNSNSIYSAGYLNKEIKSYDKDTQKYTSKFKENLMCLNRVNLVSGFLIMVLFIGLYSTTTYLFINKKINFKNLMAIFMTIIYYTPCIMTINGTLPDLIQYYGSLTATEDFIKELYDVDNFKKNNIDKPIKKIENGNIVINNLTFDYNEKTNIFKNFYITFKENEKVAIIGPSGNGKSTLVKLIMGYYKIPNNTIFIDNNDINSFDLSDLRKQISYVNQNNKLFNMSIYKNIQYGNNVSKDDIINISKKIGLDNIFKNLKDGFETNAGIDGNNLSGGQKQVIQILRNMLKNNKIVILDEPTSAIDKENKMSILNAINELSRNKTLIIITHDDSLLSLVNRVITLKSGKIIEDKYI
jgi:ABC-type multidrug transport system fused ATPase/permease subunit